MTNIYKYDDDLFVQSFIEINEKFDILVMFINGSINASSQLAPLNFKSGILSISQINFPLFKPSPSKRHHYVLNKIIFYIQIITSIWLYIFIALYWLGNRRNGNAI